METTVTLQGPLRLAVWPVLLVGAILLGGLVFVIVKLIQKQLEKKREQQRLAELEKAQLPPPVPPLELVKQKYMQLIALLEQDINMGKIANREAYEAISNLFRSFVFEATGVPAHKFTLRDMEGINMPVLYNLVNTYYVPEYSMNDKGNIWESIETTKRAIMQWY